MQALPLRVRTLGMAHYPDTLQAMRKFTDDRNDGTPDELWLLQHYPVFTQGQAGRSEHILKKSDIPIVQSDRGGQITYHGPGQAMLYALIDIQRKGINIQALVACLEQAVIELLLQHHVAAERKRGAPGVYVEGDKIASIGLRIRRGRSYHGLCFNVDMDLSPYDCIRPCGLKGIKMTKLCDHASAESMETIQHELCRHLARLMHYDNLSFE